MTTGLALRIVRGQIERLPHAPVNDLTWLQEQVGGYIECALRLDDRDGPQIMVYCNEEGHVMGMELNVARSTDYHPLAGPLVVVGCTPDGENRGLTEAEAESVRIVSRNGERLPVLSLGGL